MLVGELFKIQEHNGNDVVSARELYEFLDPKTEFSHWCKRMFEFGFIEGIDYSLVKIGERSAHNKTDYALTINCAKEVSMVQRTDKGRQARQYFLDCEKRANSKKSIVRHEPTKKEFAQWYLESENAREEAEKQLALQAPMVNYYKDALNSDGLIPTTIVAKDLQITAQALHLKLKDRKVLYRTRSGTWVPTAKYQDKGYFQTKTYPIKRKDGTPTNKNSVTTYFTESGREFAITMFRN